MLEYKTLEEDPENFTSAKKVEFYKDIILDNKVIEEAIIAAGVGGLSTKPIGLFLYNDKGASEKESWNLEFEAMNERQLLLRLADKADNREVKIE